MPRLTVRALAEMLRLPAYEQMRILAEQKHPKQEPQVFRTPYYLPALTGIRRYYRSGNDAAEIGSALGAVQSLALESRRLNNRRVLESFVKSDVRNRKLALLPNVKLSTAINSVELKLSPDLQVHESDEEKILFFNCRAAKLEEEVALLTVEIAGWVLEQCGIKIPQTHVQYVDLFTGQTHATKKRRPSTIKTLKKSAQAIEALWPSV